MHFLVLRKGFSIVTITLLHENIWPKKKRKKRTHTMFVGEEIGPWERQGHPMASLQGGTHVFIFFAFIVHVNQTMFISPPKVDLPWS